jgi:cell filamentation protein
MNKLGISVVEDLDEAEGRIVSIRDVQLARSPLPGAYNLAHLKRFHEQLFGDIYEWAGKTRYVNIFKDQDSAFCAWQFVDEHTSGLLNELQRDGHLIGLGAIEFVRRLAYFYGELIVLHPFREGNGRTIRAFLRQLGASAGFLLDWSEVRPTENIDACKHYMRTMETERLEGLLKRVVAKI